AGATTLIDNFNQQNNAPDISAYPGINRYPASFEAVSFNGDVEILDSLRLAPSEQGTLNLLAYDSLRTQNTAVSFGRVQPISTGPSLIEDAFDPLAPMAGFGPEAGAEFFDLGARLLHASDEVPDRFYAVSGDILSGPGTPDSFFIRPLS